MAQIISGSPTAIPGPPGPQGPPGIKGDPGGVSSHDSYSALRSSLDHLTSQVVNVLGHSAAGDGGHGQLFWDSTSTAADNSGTVIQPSAVSGAGRWVRHYDEINPLWFVGSDLGAQINAADAVLGSGHGAIRVPAADTHTITTKVVLSAKRTLHLGAGFYDTSTMSVTGVFALNDDCTLKGDGWSTRIQEPLNLVVAGSATSNPGSNRWSVRDLAIIGDVSQTSGLVTSAYATIGAGDGHDISVTNVLFKDTQPLAFQFGADATGGNHGTNIEFCNNILDGVRAINIAAVNAQNIRIQNNSFINPGGASGSGGTCIDLEPNADNDVMKNAIISGNTFDLRGSHLWQGITVQGHGPSGDIQSGPALVANNTFIGEDPYGTITGLVATIAIEAIAMHDIEIANNVIQGLFSQTPLVVQGCTRATVAGNQIRLNGYTTPGIAVLGTGLYTNVIGNSFFDYVPDRAVIGEDTTADYTFVQGNVLNSPAGAFGGTPVANIHLQGAHSKAAANMVNGAMSWGAIAESDVTNLTTDLAAKIASTRQVLTGAGLTGGGDLSADRTLSVDATATISAAKFVASQTVGFDLNSANPLLIGSTASLVGLKANGVNQLTASNGVVKSGNADGYAVLGEAATRWGGVWSFFYAGVAQSPSFSATPSFDPSQGETIYFVLTGNVTSWTLAAGKPGQIVTIHWTQDGTGGRTLSGTPANVRLSGGSFSLSAGANKIDSLTLRWNAALSTWIEQTRSPNI